MTTFSTFDPLEVQAAVDFCKQEFELSTGTQGNTLRDQLTSVWRQTGVKPAELQELVELPESMQGVWQNFLDLNACRSSNGMSVNGISYQDIWCYADLYNITFEDWELNLIRRMDREVMKIYASESKKQQQQNSKK